MTSLLIIEDFNVIKYAFSGLWTAQILIVVYPLAFQTTKKNFCDDIIVTVTFAPHAADNIVLFENFLIIRIKNIVFSIRSLQKEKTVDKSVFLYIQIHR